MLSLTNDTQIKALESYTSPFSTPTPVKGAVTVSVSSQPSASLETTTSTFNTVSK